MILSLYKQDGLSKIDDKLNRYVSGETVKFTEDEALQILKNKSLRDQLGKYDQVNVTQIHDSHPHVQYYGSVQYKKVSGELLFDVCNTSNATKNYVRENETVFASLFTEQQLNELTSVKTFQPSCFS